MPKPRHPGTYIREHVLPGKLAVKEAANRLGVGRPALSNLLNGNAALSPEMAVRLEKAFGADAKALLQLQAEFDQFQHRSLAPTLAIGAYVPPFLTISAGQIEDWATKNIEARSLLAVLLRKLVNSTGQGLTLVDFPGYDEAERKGWDGRVDAGGATQWIPDGLSGWEFGCNEDYKQKADKDFAARVKAIDRSERTKMHFRFVTPRIWRDKEKWRKDKESLGEWKSVRAHDASDIEQWLEQSLPAQRWLSEKIDIPYDGVYSLEGRWRAWASVTEPELSKALFTPSVEHFKETVKAWIKDPSPSPLIVSGDSKLEAIAFLHCMFETPEEVFSRLQDRIIVFSSGHALRKLATTNPGFVPVAFSDEAERELGGHFRNRHAIIVRPRNAVDPEPTITLDLLGSEAFRKALEEMGIKDHHRIDELGREAGYSPTILRRRLSILAAIRKPEWAQDNLAVRRLVPLMFVGAWHTQSKGDCEIMSVLAGKSCDEVELDIAELLRRDDPPVWSAGKFRGVASKIDAFFVAQEAVTPKDLQDFFFAAEIVLAEEDPALDLPDGQSAFADLYGKSREHSDALRKGICESLVLLAIHGNRIFGKRLGMNIEAQVNRLIRRLLTGDGGLNPKKLRSQQQNLPLYAEAAPEEFLKIIEQDLRSPDPQVHSLMTPADTGIFSSCPRTGLLWALENLAWNAETLPRVCRILARLSEREINDNWANKPERSIEDIFRSWMPQTAAPLDARIRTLEQLTKNFPDVGWNICVAQFLPGTQVGHYTHRPQWRSDASGAGHLLTQGESLSFVRKCADLALAWPSHDERTLGDLVENLQGLPPDDQNTVWDLVLKWAAKEADEERKAILRERIRRFALTRSASKLQLSDATKDRARRAYSMLQPSGPVARHRWLFEQQWVQESIHEIAEPDFDFEKHGERIRRLRIDALNEIWDEGGFKGIQELLSRSGAPFTVGSHLADGVITDTGAADMIVRCLNVQEPDLISKVEEVLRGFLHGLQPAVRDDLTRRMMSELPSALRCRLLLQSPFESSTWSHVNAQSEAVSTKYWREVVPAWGWKDSPDLNEAVDCLLAARRPRAAFVAVQFAIAELETSRLKRLLQEVGTCDAEKAGTYQIDGYHLSEALDILQERVGISEDEMARLEFLFIGAIEHQRHGIPNLEKQLGKSPALFVQVLGLLYRRRDGGEDPPEWRVDYAERGSALGTAAYCLLANFRRIPGTNANGNIDEVALRAWVKQVQSLCAEYGRAEIGDHKIGEILCSPRIGKDGLWPCEEVRKVMEECGTSQLAEGFQIGVYNSRGVHLCGEGGGDTRALADKYRTWARQLAFDYPYVSNVVKGIAQRYDQEAAWEDSEAAVRRRLDH